MWNTLYTPPPFFGSGSGGPTGRWYFTGNGLDQNINVVNVEITPNDTITFKYIAPPQSLTGAKVMLASSLVNVFYVLNGKFYTDIPSSTLEMRVDGSVITGGVTDAPDDGLEHEISIKLLSGAIAIKNIGKGKDDSDFYCDLTFFDFKVNEGSVYNFPLDDSFANNPTARNAGSGADGEYINATEASWSFE